MESAMYQLDENDPDGWKKFFTDLFYALAGMVTVVVTIAWLVVILACIKFVWGLV
jgi:hypothetical protein